MLRKSIVLSLALLVLTTSLSVKASGSEVDADSWQTGIMLRRTLQHDGIEREYYVYLPTSFTLDKQLPIVLMLHGYGGSATGIALETSGGFNRYAEKMGYIAVYPQGTHYEAKTSEGQDWFITSWNVPGGNKSKGPMGPLCTADSFQYPCPPECGSCGHCHWTSCHDDIGFMRQLMQEIQAVFNSDASRQFLTGFSNGSMMSQVLACEMAEYWSAVALVSGRLSLGYSCAPGEALPLLQIDGVKDEVMPHDESASSGGYFYTPAIDVSRAWAKAAGCEYEPVPYKTNFGKKDNIQCQVQDACGVSGIEIISCLLPEGTHTWPGHGVLSGWCAADEQKDTIKMKRCEEPDPDKQIWGSQMILEFFERHRAR